MSNHEQYIFMAAEVAKSSLCLKKKCGAVIVKDGVVIGRGYNAPPLNDLSHRLCGHTKPSSGKPKSDRTCCVHAEWRAIMNALGNNGNSIVGSSIYYGSLDKDNNFRKAGKPYCTVCSRLALDVGISFWYLWHESGIKRYFIPI
jgi:deoxycytidylate deaminase